MEDRVRQLKTQYRLVPLEGEGGFVRRTLTGAMGVNTSAVKASSRGSAFAQEELPMISHIYYLITKESFSHLHRISSCELWTWMEGDPAEMILLDDDSKLEKRILGPEGIHKGVTLVEGGLWQGTRSISEGKKGYTLFSIAVVPSFDPADFTLADHSILASLDIETGEYIRPFLVKEDVV